MIKCEYPCPKKYFDGCCFFCERKDCIARCTQAPAHCEHKIAENTEEPPED